MFEIIHESSGEVTQIVRHFHIVQILPATILPETVQEAQAEIASAQVRLEDVLEASEPVTPRAPTTKDAESQVAGLGLQDDVVVPVLDAQQKALMEVPIDTMSEEMLFTPGVPLVARLAASNITSV